MRRHARLASLLFVLAASLILSTSASAQVVDLSGVWAPLMHEDAPERAGGPDVGDYLGLPLTEAGRMRAETWDASILTLPEHQCKPHPSTYGMRGVGNLRIWSDVDDATQQLIKINTQIQWMEQKREIWMDGRPHPPEYAAHTWQGFSTGRFVANQLVVRTDHLKNGWARRNGVLLSDKASMEERFLRHGETITHVYMITDPYYLSEPVIKTSGFRLTNQTALQPYPCDSVIEVVRDRGVVPHKLPSDKHFLMDFAKKYNIPYEASRGGIQTAMPEYARQIASQAAAPRPAN
jgi:hypothetical protein